MLTKLTDPSLKLRKDYKKVTCMLSRSLYPDWMKDFLTCDFKNLMIYMGSSSVLVLVRGNQRSKLK